MAETGVAIAAARAAAVAELAAAIDARRDARGRQPLSLGRAGAGRHARSGARRARPPSTSRTTTARARAGARARPRRRPHARRPASLRSDRRARPQGDAGQGVLHRRAEGAADRPRAGARRPRRGSAATAPRPSCCSTRSRPISTRCAAPPCSRRSSLWAARPGCRAPIWRLCCARRTGAIHRVEDGRDRACRAEPPTRPDAAA